MKVETGENCAASAITALEQAPLFLQMIDRRVSDPCVFFLRFVCKVVVLIWHHFPDVFLEATANSDNVLQFAYNSIVQFVNFVRSIFIMITASALALK